MAAEPCSRELDELIQADNELQAAVEELIRLGHPERNNEIMNGRSIRKLTYIEAEAVRRWEMATIVRDEKREAYDACREARKA